MVFKKGKDLKKEFCQICSKTSTCVELCSEVEKELKKVTKSNYLETPHSHIDNYGTLSIYNNIDEFPDDPEYYEEATHLESGQELSFDIGELNNAYADEINNIEEFVDNPYDDIETDKDEYIVRPIFSEKQHKCYNEDDIIDRIDHSKKYPLSKEIKYDALKSNFFNFKLKYISLNDFKKLMEHLFYKKDEENKKNKNYFESFLKCKKIKEIAKLAGCSEQNLQKKFQGWIRKAGEIFTQGQKEVIDITTPGKFKKSLITV